MLTDLLVILEWNVEVHRGIESIEIFLIQTIIQVQEFLAFHRIVLNDLIDQSLIIIINLLLDLPTQPNQSNQSINQ